ncbi:hypothetical protein FOA52_002306 [Chlamydomonas sp. UWO 241]|nr:hypothetical protein FOA52_002306 [Chlamydomonas sp. UWO 241]
MMQLTKQTTFATSRASALRTSAVPRPTNRCTVVVRAVDGEKTPEVTPPPAAAPVSATSTPPTMLPPAAVQPPPPAPPAAKAVGFGDVMAFLGIGPELINGRLAMIGFVAALGAELSSGEPVLSQWASEPTGIAVAFLLVIAGSLVPFLSGNKNTKAVGPLTPSAEMTNGRAAMIGFAALLIVEFASSGKALF